MSVSTVVDAVASANNLSKAEARRLVDSVLGAIGDAAARGEEIALPGFGKFKVVDKPARTGRNPSTGETIAIAASKKLTFAPAKAVKERLNG